MASHVSYGIVPLQNVDGEWQVLIIHREKGFWEFPKGHAEKGEDPLEAASRELFEETGLSLKNLIYDVPIKIEYSFEDRGETINKCVYYFLGEVSGEVALQKEEVVDSLWISLKEAPQYLTYENSKELCRKMIYLLN